MRVGLGMPYWNTGPARWWHPKAVFALDPFNGRYARQGVRLTEDGALTVMRSSSHLLAGSDGVLRSFGPNVLARVNGVGAYIGGQVTNAEVRSQEFNDAAWAKDNSTITADAVAAPDGTLTADKLVGSAVTATHSVYKGSNSYANGTVYVEDVYAKAAEHSWFQLTTTSTLGTDKWANFNLTGNGAVGNKGAGCTAFIYKLANGWYWCGIIFTSPGAVGGGKSCVLTNNANSAARGPSYLGDGGSGIYLWGAGSVASKFAVPYIPTAGAAVTCYASDVRAAGMSWFSAASLASGFSVLAVVNFSHVGDAVARRLINFSDGTASNELRLGIDSSGLMRLSSIVGGVGQVSLPIAVAAGVGRYKVAANFVQGAWSLLDSAGNSATLGTGTAPANLSDFRIGQDASGGSPLNDTIEKLQVCRPLSAVEAQAWMQAA